MVHFILCLLCLVKILFESLHIYLIYWFKLLFQGATLKIVVFIYVLGKEGLITVQAEVSNSSKNGRKGVHVEPYYINPLWFSESGLWTEL